jgi:hypothetical protein
VIRGGETVAIPLKLRPPGIPGTYTFRVSIPSRGLVTEPRTVEIRERPLATSLDTPHLLAATYMHTQGSRPLIVTKPGPFPLEVVATNAGQSIWLARAKHDKGAVRLGWRWFRDGQKLAGSSGRAPIRYDVFPGQAYRFHVAVTPPPAAGSYILELGLVSELVTWFSDVGTPPLKLIVDVRADLRQAFATLIEQLKIPVGDAPVLALSADRVSDLSRLTLTAKIGERSWVVDAYLVLQGPDGALSFYDGQGLVPRGKGAWPPLAKGVELRERTRGSVPLVHLPLAGMGRGT